MDLWSAVALFAITLVGATVNGALGYGFSSITVPLALLFLTNRVLNPAVVLVEVVLNTAVLYVNRASIPVVTRRALPIVVGLVPGVIVGTLVVTHVDTSLLKFYTFTALLPLILLQAAGYRRPIESERSAGFVFGNGLGILYSTTTISGPPLAVVLSNQGVAKQEFRAALSIVRLCESVLTATAYLYAGMFTTRTLALSAQIVPTIAIGIPVGAFVIRRIRTETFRRVCMSFDAWIVAFGLATVLRTLAIVEGPAAYLVVAIVGAIDAVLLYRFFSDPVSLRRTKSAADATVAA